MKKIFTSKIFLSLFIFISVVALLGIPYTQWGFKTDDFGNIFHSKVYGWETIKNFFIEGDIEHFNNPSNVIKPEQAFFAGLYRPVSFLYYAVQYYFFQDSAYGYFLVTVAFHALNAVLLFHLFTYIFSLLFAFLAALFFAFHPSLWNWLGWISAQTYFIELFVVLLLLIALKKYLDTRNILFYVLSCFLFLSNLFLKEATIVLPPWIMMSVFYYLFYIQRKYRFWESVIQSFIVSLGYWAGSIFYIFVRLSLFPLTSNTATLTFEPTFASFCARMKSRIFDFVTYVVDMVGLTWMPGNNRFFKFFIIAAIILGLAGLFIRSSKKRYVVFCLLSIPFFSWPALLMHYKPRYIYMAIPFFIMIFFLLLKDISYKKIIAGSFTFLIIFQAWFLVGKMKQRETILHKVTQSFRVLLQDKRVHSKPLCFIGLPMHWFAMGTAQAMWLMGSDVSYPIYQYGPTVCMHDITSYLNIPVLKENCLTVVFENGQFTFFSSNVEKMWFNLVGKKIKEASLLVPEQCRKQNPVYILWDYQNARFKILD